MSGQTREYANDGAVSVLRLLAGTQEVTAATRQELHHDGRKSMLHATWHVKVQDLVTSGLRLDYLIVDLENSHCPDRCCRDAFETRLFPLVQALVDGSQEKVDFVGVTDAEEEARIRSVIWANT